MTKLQPNSYIPGLKEKQRKIHTSQGIVLTGDKAEEFKKMALEVMEGNNEVIKILDDLEEEKERRRLEEENNKPTLKEICKLLIDSGNSWLITSADLIEKTGNIDEKDNDGHTALHISSWLGHIDIVDKLLKAGADIEARDDDGWISLIFASSNGQTEIIKLLLDKGANIEARDDNGRTPLIHASEHGKTEIVKLLIDRGTRVNERNNIGETALRLAGNQETRDLLISYGATE